MASKEAELSGKTIYPSGHPEPKQGQDSEESMEALRENTLSYTLAAWRVIP